MKCASLWAIGQVKYIAAECPKCGRWQVNDEARDELECDDCRVVFEQKTGVITKGNQ